MWVHRKKTKKAGRTFDAFAGRAVEWYRIADQAAVRYYSVPTGDRVRYTLKSSIHSWLLRKHAVLQDALEKVVILQIDVLNAVVCDCSSRNFRHFFVHSTDSGSQLEIDILELETRLVS